MRWSKKKEEEKVNLLVSLNSWILNMEGKIDKLADQLPILNLMIRKGKDVSFQYRNGSSRSSSNGIQKNWFYCNNARHVASRCREILGHDMISSNCGKIDH